MAALAVLSALVVALCIGYHFGRRAGTRPPTWKKRTSRARLGRLAISLTMLMIARRIQHRVLVQRALPDALAAWGTRFVAPLHFSGQTRRSWRGSTPRRPIAAGWSHSIWPH
jgi:hypothetical protein